VCFLPQRSIAGKKCAAEIAVREAEPRTAPVARTRRFLFLLLHLRTNTHHRETPTQKHRKRKSFISFQIIVFTT
jgi:hypothetical protein